MKTPLCMLSGFAVLIAVVGCSSVIRPATRATPSPQPTRQEASSSTPVSAGYANPGFLVEAAWLREHVSDPNVRVVALASPAEYAKGHIPGAVQIDLPDLGVTDTSDSSIERWRGDVEKLLGERGISPENTVIVYDYGSLYAARVWWVLAQLNHKDKRILDGGYAAWQSAQGKADVEPSEAKKTTYRGTAAMETLASRKYVLDHLKDPSVAILDVRAAEEYAAGHIPGAANISYQENAQSVEPRFTKTQVELDSLYRAKGISPDKEVIVYCRTGVRASVTYFTLRLMGYKSVRLYPGSWAEWSSHADLPVEK